MIKIREYPANPALSHLLEEICVAIQLTASQDALSRQHYEAVAKWLAGNGSPLSYHEIHIFPQGSQNLGTTTKPPKRQEFDLDAVCLVKNSGVTHPGRLYSIVHDRLKSNGLYADRIEKLPRCVRINYSGDFHLDIVPAIIDAEREGNFILVPELDADLSLLHPQNDLWKTSSPKNYADWFEEQCIIRVPIIEKMARAQVDPLPDRETADEKPPLKRIVQLLKRWRDIEYADRPKLSPPSIILTTLAGMFYGGGIHCCQSIQCISMEILDWLERCQPVTLMNPGNEDEEICEKWQNNPDCYEDFCETFAVFEERWRRLMTLKGPALYRELSEMFDESPVEKALKAITDREISQPRSLNQLTVKPRDSGLLLGGGAIPSTLPVRKNNFFGNSR